MEKVKNIKEDINRSADQTEGKNKGLDRLFENIHSKGRKTNGKMVEEVRWETLDTA